MRLPLMMPSNLKSEDAPVPETADPKSTGDAFTMGRKAEHESMLRSQRWWQIPRQLSRVIS
jgi:hypothetical protein